MKSEVCKSCCPQGGAYFEQVGKYDDDHNFIGWQKQCRNCGEFKQFRKQKPRPSYDEITTTLASDEKLRNIKEHALFHYFNPNGAVQKWEIACKKIDEAVSAGKMKSGAILAYGSMNDHHREALYKQIRLKCPKVWNVHYHVRGLREAAERAEQKAAEAMAEECDRVAA